MAGNGLETVLGPNPFEDSWNRGNPGQLADPSGSDAAAASGVPGETGQVDTGFDDSWLTDEERSQVDPNDPTYQMLMRAMARRVREPAESADSGLAAQMEALRFQKEFDDVAEPGEPQQDVNLWDGFKPSLDFPPELKDYEDAIMSRIRDAANHVIGVATRNEQAREQARQNREIRTRVRSEVSELLRGHSAQAFRQDMSAVMQAANSNAGKALLLDPSVGVRGIWNLVRAQRGEAPITALPPQQQLQQPQQQMQRQAPRVFPGDKRNHQVERTVPSVSQSAPAASQLPEPTNLRDAIQQAFVGAAEQARSRRV